MDIRLSDEQQMLQETAARIAAAHRGDNPANLGDDSGGHRLWSTLSDAGLLSLLIPESSGGAEVTALEACIVASELGAVTAPVPYVEQAVVAPWLLAAIDCEEQLEALIDGARLTPAFTTDLSAFAGPGSEVIVDADAQAALSIDADGVVRLHQVERSRRLEYLDLTRGRVRAELDDGTELGRLDADTRDGLEALALTAVAADLVGVMGAALDEAVRYLCDRTQFGQAIGSFQALQHLAADAAVLVEASRSSLLHAAWAVDALPGSAALLAARQAKAYISGAARTVVETAIQCHGGVAVTWEHPMHLRLRRALAGDQILGDVRTQELAIASGRLGPEFEEPTVPVAQDSHGIDFGDSPEEAEFRARLRSWLVENEAPEVGGGPDSEMEAQHVWHQRLADAGWVGLSFPAEYGGRGLTPLHDAILNDELGAAGAPPAPAINHITNAIRLFGTEEQKRTQLPGMLSCRVRWCQGFSEPNAGSDLASLTTVGERFTTEDGTEAYRVRGQKIWTSEALWSHWCLLMLRTESDLAAHRGLSMLMVPMDTPGLEVRPIVTAYGSREFAEVFFDDAIVPADNLLGRPGQGWEIAMALLGFERGPADMGWTARLARQLSLVEAAVRVGELEADQSQRRTLAAAWVELEALRIHVQRSTSARLDGSAPGPEGSIDKLLMTSADQHLSHALAEVLRGRTVLDPDEFFPSYVWSRAQSIFGGTQQIQRNIVAQRVLGLPR